MSTVRVIAGTYRSRMLAAPRGSVTRPTSDRLRETLFNVLQPRLAGCRFLDLFAGSGAVGIEALSRGAAHVCFAEKDAAALASLRENLRALGIRDGFMLEAGGTAALLGRLLTAKSAAEIVFLDPPYEQDEAYRRTLNALGSDAAEVLAPGALVIAEHSSKLPLAGAYGNLRQTRVLRQGDASLSFFAAAGNGD